MKDYFAALISEGVTGVTRGNIFLKPSEIASVDDQELVTPENFSKGNGGNQLHNLFPFVSHSNSNGVTLEAKQTNAYHPLHPVTLRNEDLAHFYHERAAIIEFDGKLSRNEAERLASQETLISFLMTQYPEILDEYSSLIHRFII